MSVFLWHKWIENIDVLYCDTIEYECSDSITVLKSLEMDIAAS